MKALKSGLFGVCSEHERLDPFLIRPRRLKHGCVFLWKSALLNGGFPVGFPAKPAA